jgi:hypothetical protein
MRVLGGVETGLGAGERNHRLRRTRRKDGGEPQREVRIRESREERLCQRPKAEERKETGDMKI